MTDVPPQAVFVEATFADAARAERAAVQLQEHGVAPDNIDVEHGVNANPGRTAVEDTEIANRMGGSWWIGVLTGALLGGLIGALIGAVTFGVGTPGFWAVALGCGGGGAGAGAMYGLFAGFSKRAQQTERYDDDNTPDMPDAVRVVATVDRDQIDTARRIMRQQGGTIS